MARLFALLAACALAERSAAARTIHSSAKFVQPVPAATFAPEQIRLAHTQVDTEMAVHWATSNLTNDDYQGVVQWGPDAGSLTFSAAATLQLNYTAFTIKSPSLHFATMTGLAHQTQVFYRVGSLTQGWSPIYNFTSSRALGTKSYPFSFVTFGDMGISYSNWTAALLAKMSQDGELDLIVHAGDISYADNRASINHGTIYDGVINQYFNEMMPATAQTPYMLSSGNHEAILDFLAYRTRVAPTMPIANATATPFWYSYSVGPVHFTAYDYDQSWSETSEQYAFVSSDLKGVDKSVTPWTIAYNHFPLICSNYFFCPSAGPFRAVYEPLFNAPDSRVDFHLAGHVHASEAVYPSVNGTVTQFSFNDVSQVLHLLVGNAGDEEINCCSDWAKPAPAYSAFRDDIYVPDGGYYGFTKVILLDDTHANVEFWDAVNQTVVYSYQMSRPLPAGRV